MRKPEKEKQDGGEQEQWVGNTSDLIEIVPAGEMMLMSINPECDWTVNPEVAKDYEYSGKGEGQ